MRHAIRSPRRALALALLLVLPALARADMYSLEVSATANIYGAGHAVAPGPDGNGGGILPPVVTLPAGGQRVLRIVSTSGAIRYSPVLPFYGADGTNNPLSAAPDWGGLAGHRLDHIRVLSAVVLDNSEPVDPPPLKLLADSLTFTQLAPGLRQIFPLGDGLTGTAAGDTQRFVLPDEATRLYLGFIDSYSGTMPGWYSDNSGSLTVQFSVTVGVPVAVERSPVAGFAVLPPVGNALKDGAHIRYRLPGAASVEIRIVDPAGRLVRDLGAGGVEPAGPGERTWDGRDAAGRRVAAGLYFARLRSGAGEGVARLIAIP